MQYIGSRYVPKVEGEYDSSKAYESLSVVLYNNSSYTSKKPVPAGILPTNTEYWAKTGDYNAQVATVVKQLDGTTDSGLKTLISSHTSNMSNPHNVTADQLGKTINSSNLVEGAVTNDKLSDDSGVFAITLGKDSRIEPVKTFDGYKVAYNPKYGLFQLENSKTSLLDTYVYPVTRGNLYNITNAVVGGGIAFPFYVFSTTLVSGSSYAPKYAQAEPGSKPKQEITDFKVIAPIDGYLYVNGYSSDNTAGTPIVSSSKIRVAFMDAAEINGILFDGTDYTHFHSLSNGKYLCRVFHHAFVNNLLQLYHMYIGEFTESGLTQVKDIGTAASDNVGPISIHRGETDSWSGSWAGGSHGYTVSGKEYPTATETSLKVYCGGEEVSKVGYYFGDVTIVAKNDLYFPKSITGSDLSAATKAIQETRTYRLGDKMHVDVELSFYAECYIVTYYACQMLTFDMTTVTFPDNELSGETARDANLVLTEPESVFIGRNNTSEYRVSLMTYGIGDMRYNSGTNELGYGYLATFGKAYYMLIANESGKVRRFTTGNVLAWGADYDYRVLSD